ncbi:MAG TPA: tetratricopeptide repeat protein [Pseudolabrys sp.]|nr:tetratricopeptide repeat protein [Pseudolabrys sp.]
MLRTPSLQRHRIMPKPQPEPTGNVSAADLVRRAIAQHQRGHLSDAEKLYRQALNAEPDHFDALHLYGVLRYQRGEHADALTLLARALKTGTRSAAAHSNYGMVLAACARHQEALENYERAIALKPDYAEALNNRGNALRALKRPLDALTSFERAIAVRPDYAEALNNRGNCLVDLGRHDEALESYSEAVRRRPAYLDALVNRANILRVLGRHGEALMSLDEAIALDPDRAQTYLSKGNLLLEIKRPAEAVLSYDRAIALAPTAVEALANRGRALRELKRYDDSLASYDRALSIKPDDANLFVGRGNTRYVMQAYAAALADYDRAIAIRPDFAEAHGNRGNALREMGRHREALEACDRALLLKPDYNEGYNNRGNVLVELNRPAEALADYDRALDAVPDNVYAWVNRGNALRYLNRCDEAIASFDRAIELAPDLAEAHWNKGLLCLSIGDFARGWAGYEWRWKRDGELRPRDFTQPQWRGEELNGKTILLHAEQGFGDSIQFIRYLPMVAEKGGKIILEIPDGLAPLVEKSVRADGIYRRSDPLPQFDVHCPLLSLPLAFGTTLGTVPAKVPYLQAPAARAKAWRAQFAGIRRPRVGLVWSGKPSHKNDHNRSIALSRFEPILSMTGMEFISLQREYRDSDLEALARLPIRRFDGLLADFAETAAAISELDLVIAVDTAVAHLAGAMAKPLWVLLPHIQDWRWLRERNDSPWYPTARLFRQPPGGGWDEVIAAAAKALSDFRQACVMASET